MAIIVDQALSSLTNFLPGVYAAHVLAPADFGVFGLIQLAYALAVGVLMSSCGNVAMVSKASNTPTKRHLGSVDAVAGISVAGAAIALPVIVASAGASASVVALTLLGLVIALTQDSVRLMGIATGRGSVAAVNDALWLLSLVALLPLVAGFLDPSPWVIAATWMLASAPGLIYGANAIGWRPRLARGLWFLREQPRLSLAFLGEWSMRTGATQATTYALGLIGGLVIVAQIRASQLLLGPLNIAFSGAVYASMPSVLSRRESSFPAMRRVLWWLSFGMGAICVLAGALAAALPENWLALIVGDQANGIRPYVLPVALTLAGAGFTTGSALGLQVLHEGGRLTTARFISSMVSVGAGALGYLATGTALGGLWGLALGGLLGVLAWEGQFRSAYRRAVTDRETKPSSSVDRPI